MPTHSHEPGTFCWFELATIDQPAAVQFYQALFGWSVYDQPIGPGEIYSIFRLDGRDTAAAFTMRRAQREQGVQPNWLLYIAVANADDAAARAAVLGGTILTPALDVMDAGRLAILQDPAGAVFAVWQAASHAGVGIADVPGTACWADLSTPDQARAGQFYSDLFGWAMVKGKDMTPADAGEYFHIMRGGTFIGGIPPSAHRAPGTPPHWLVYFSVENCDDSTDLARSHGARVLVEPTSIDETGRFSVLADPMGAAFALFQPGPEAA